MKLLVAIFATSGLQQVGLLPRVEFPTVSYQFRESNEMKTPVPPTNILVAALLLVAMPGASIVASLFLVAMPGAPSSVLAPGSDARSPY